MERVELDVALLHAEVYVGHLSGEALAALVLLGDPQLAQSHIRDGQADRPSLSQRADLHHASHLQ